MASLKIPRIDLHIHTNFSDGKATVDEVVKTSRVKGFEAIAITDHYSATVKLPGRMWRTDVARYLDALDAAGVVRGVEVDILEDGSVTMDRDGLRTFNHIIASIHIFKGVKFWGDPTPIIKPEIFVEGLRVSMVEAMETRLFHVLGHFTWLPDSIRLEAAKLLNDGWVEDVVEAASRNDVAIEISGVWMVPPLNVVETCLHKGVKLSIGSDAHTIQEVGCVQYPMQTLKQAGATVEDLYIPKALLLRSSDEGYCL